MAFPTGDWLAHQARANPQGLALIAGDARWTYAELNARVAGWCASLSAVGVAPGVRVGTLLHNAPEAVALVHALARLGAVGVPLNARLGADELRTQAAHARCEFLVFHGETQSLAAAVTGNWKTLSVEDLAAAPADPSGWTEGPLDLEATQAVVFTSGSADAPKGVCLSFSNHFFSALGSGYRLGVLPDDRWLLCLPLWHVGGLAIVWRCCLYGIPLVLLPRFDAEGVAAAVERERVSLISLVPTMLHGLLPHWKIVPASLRTVLMGGAAIPEPLLRQALELGLPLAASYGLTEAASQVATLAGAGLRRKPGSVGKPLLFTRVTVTDEADQPLGMGEVGQIVVHGPTVMQGYDAQPELTARALSPHGLQAGDFGFLDEDGDLWLVGRRTDLIVSGGENIYAAQVEGALRAHPAVLDACVVGAPDPRWGQCVVAAIVPRGAACTPEALDTFLEERLARYKRPRRYRLVDALPLTASGKPDRRTVAAWFADDSLDS